MAPKLHLCALIWLVLWLALSTVRQVFDIIGKLWALVLIDMVQLFAIVSGLIALCQPSLTPCRNRLLLTVLALISALSVGHNVAVLLWFCTDLLVADHRQSDLLSFGLPFGHSFFLRHSPLCNETHSNGSGVEQWEEQLTTTTTTTEHCPIQYSHLEGGQAVLHTLMALGTLLLVVAILLWNTNDDDRSLRYGSARTAERSVKKYGFAADDYVTAAGARDTTVSPTAKELSSIYMEPSSCCFEDAHSGTGSVQLVASGKTMPTPALAPVVVGGVVRRSYPRAGRRPAPSGAVGGPLADGADCPQRGKRGNLKKPALNRSTPASPAPVVPSPAGVVHERYSSLSTTGATDGIQPHFQHQHRAILNSNNNTTSSSSTASAYGGESNNSNNNNSNTMASNGSGGNSYRNRVQQAHQLQYTCAYSGQRRPSASFYTPLSGPGAADGLTPRSLSSFGSVGDRSIAMQQLTQYHLPYTTTNNNNYRRGGSMRTFCTVAAGGATECDEPCAAADYASGIAGDHAVQRRQRVSFSPPAVLSHCSPPPAQHFAALRRGADGRRSAGPVAGGDHSSNGRAPTIMANFWSPNQQHRHHHAHKNPTNTTDHHMTSLISFDPKSNTLIRVREHRRPSSSSASSAASPSPDNGGASGDRYMAPAVGAATTVTSSSAIATTSGVGGDWPLSLAPDLAPRFEPIVSAAGQIQRHPINNSTSNPAPTRNTNLPSLTSIGNNGQPKSGYGDLASSNNGYGSSGQIGQKNSHPMDNLYNQIDDGHDNCNRTNPTKTTIAAKTTETSISTTNAIAAPNANASMYEAYVGTAVPLVDATHTAFPALINGCRAAQKQSPTSSTDRRRSLLFDCSAASAIRLSSQQQLGDAGASDNGSATTVATADCGGDKSQAAAAAFRPRVGTTNDTMLGMFV